MEKRYRVSADLQGGDFGMGRIYTVEQWREQAIDWADMDEHDGLIETLKALPKDEVLDEIAEFWQLEFEEVYTDLDVYSYKYDYDDIKVAVVIAEMLKDWNRFCDYEDVAKLIIIIKDSWKELHSKGLLLEEEFAYMQKFAVNYMNEHKKQIMEELQ